MAQTADIKRTVAPALTTMFAGAGAGMSEVLVCHPLDTIKVRMQLSKTALAGTTSPGLVGTAVGIVKNETMSGLYRGLGAVFIGIIPKMAIRFTSYEFYKGLLTDGNGKITRKGTFMAGLAAGVTEAVIVVNPTEVVKIRLQSAARNASTTASRRVGVAETISTMVKNEGLGVLYRGVTLTALRQGTNQAANFTTYTELKSLLYRLQPHHNTKDSLPAYQTTLIGLLSGATGPLMNAPIDTIKTRLQQSPTPAGQSNWSYVTNIVSHTTQKEGIKSFWKGITPRVMRVAPGQAVTFTVYEFLRKKIEGRS